MNAPAHDPLLCGLDWESTCEHCRTLFPQYVPLATPGEAGQAKRPPVVWVSLNYDEIINKVSLAFKVLCSDGRTLWIPLSQIENYGAEYGVGFKNGTMLVTAWIARKKSINEGSQEPERPPEDYPQEDDEFGQYEDYDDE